MHTTNVGVIDKHNIFSFLKLFFCYLFYNELIIFFGSSSISKFSFEEIEKDLSPSSCILSLISSLLSSQISSLISIISSSFFISFIFSFVLLLSISSSSFFSNIKLPLKFILLFF